MNIDYHEYIYPLKLYYKFKASVIVNGKGYDFFCEISHDEIDKVPGWRSIILNQIRQNIFGGLLGKVSEDKAIP